MRMDGMVKLIRNFLSVEIFGDIYLDKRCGEGPAQRILARGKKNGVDW